MNDIHIICPSHYHFCAWTPTKHVTTQKCGVFSLSEQNPHLFAPRPSAHHVKNLPLAPPLHAPSLPEAINRLYPHEPNAPSILPGPPGPPPRPNVPSPSHSPYNINPPPVYSPYNIDPPPVCRSHVLIADSPSSSQTSPSPKG